MFNWKLKNKINNEVEITFNIDLLTKEEIEKQIMFYNDNYLKLKDTIENERQDMRLEKLELIDPENPLLNIVSSDLDENLPKIKHEIKMLSLKKITNDIEKVVKWIESKNWSDFIVQPKLDWHSLSLIYEWWKLLYSKVRWDWEYWNDVTKNSKFISWVLNKINDNRKIEIRWEAIIKNSDFKEISWLFENARNGISIVNPKTTQDIIDRKMSFIAYNIFVDWKNLLDEKEKFKILEELWFNIPYYEVYNKKELLNKEKVDSIINWFDKFRKDDSELNYLIDWLVIKIDSHLEQIELWENNHEPNWAMAYKYLSEEKKTKLKDLEWNISRKWYLIPVWILDTIKLSWTNVSRVTLNNFSYIKDWDIRLWDELIIRKSWEIIPFLVKNLSREERNEKNIHEEKHLNYPINCPCCNSLLENKWVHLKCNNNKCWDKVKKQIEFFAESLWIENFWEWIVSSLFNKNILNTPSDIFNLEESSFDWLEWFWQTLSKKIIKNIDKIKNTSTPQQVIKCIWIDWLWERVATKILKKYWNIKNLIENINIDDLSKIEWIWEINSNTFYNWIIENKDFLIEISNKLNVLELNLFENASNLLEWKSFCITWTLSKWRKEIEDLIEKNWWNNKKDINKNTNYLVLWEWGWSKFEKAEKLISQWWDIKIISEEEFLNLLK